MKVRFTLNQIGLACEFYKDNDWCYAAFFSNAKIEKLGGIPKIKSQILMGIADRFELVPEGEYSDGPGRTVLCV